MERSRRNLTSGIVALAAAMALTLAPATAAQADVTVTTPAGLQAQLAAPTDVIRLGDDIVVGATTPLILGSGTTATLDLNGHDLQVANSANGIWVSNATLVIRDGAGGGSLTSTSSAATAIGGVRATIRIESGHVEAQGSAVGIGGNGATIEISGGTVIAQGGYGAGIGAAADASDGGSVLISGGVVTGIGDIGAGIGGGEDSNGTDVTITGGTVTATGWTGAGIGGGEEGRAGTITISGGDITASTGQFPTAGTAIGPGYAGSPGPVLLSGGEVRANAGGASPAIGASSITMSGGDVTAVGRLASAIGFDATTFVLTGGHLIADTVDSQQAAVRGASATLHGAASPASTATDGGDGLVGAAVDYAEVPAFGVFYTAISRRATPLVTARAEVQFHLQTTFDAAGGTPAPPDQIVDWGGQATEPTVTRTGYLLDGWRIGSATGTEWDFTDPVTAPLDLVAAWVADVATISGTPSDGIYDTPYSYAMTVGGTGSTVAVHSGTLPPGLSVSSSGVISGTPTAVGSYSSVLRATNGGGSADQAITIEILGGAAQAVTFDAAGGDPEPGDQSVPRGATATEPAEPTRLGHVFDGWRVGSATGVEWDFDDPVTGPLDLVAAWIELPTITGAATASGTAGVAFTPYTPTVTGPGVTVTDDGDLPAGLILDSATGAITGTPTGAAGSYAVTLTATNAGGSAQHTVTITIDHGAAVVFTATASDTTPRQGQTITISVIATDAYGNSWDATSGATITSDVATDVIVGNSVRFRHASPHVLTITLPPLAAQQLVIQVSPVGALGLTGSEGAGVALPIALLAILGGTSLVLLRRRRAA